MRLRPGPARRGNICGLYLRLLLEKNLDVPQILVVTFTNAATAELRARIRRRLVDVLAYLRHGTIDGDRFVASLVAAVAGNAGVDRQQMLTRVHAALHAFDEAAVFTIHGFCQRALADTPFAAGLPLSLDPLPDEQPLRLEAVSDFWRRHVAGARISPALADYLAQRQDCPKAGLGCSAANSPSPIRADLGQPNSTASRRQSTPRRRLPFNGHGNCGMAMAPSRWWRCWRVSRCSTPPRTGKTASVPGPWPTAWLSQGEPLGVPIRS